jgi:D-hexose-6-phosphate mutarotase
MGHFLCFPYFGGTNSKFEKALGYEAHGEATVVNWKVDQTRSFNFKGGVASRAKRHCP